MEEILSNHPSEMDVGVTLAWLRYALPAGRATSARGELKDLRLLAWWMKVLLPSRHYGGTAGYRLTRNQWTCVLCLLRRRAVLDAPRHDAAAKSLLFVSESEYRHTDTYSTMPAANSVQVFGKWVPLWEVSIISLGSYDVNSLCPWCIVSKNCFRPTKFLLSKNYLTRFTLNSYSPGKKQRPLLLLQSKDAVSLRSMGNQSKISSLRPCVWKYLNQFSSSDRINFPTWTFASASRVEVSLHKSTPSARPLPSRSLHTTPSTWTNSPKTNCERHWSNTTATCWSATPAGANQRNMVVDRLVRASRNHIARDTFVVEQSLSKINKINETCLFCEC